MTRDLSRLLRPRNIAVVGGGTWCANVIRECRDFGFGGPIWSVHPKKKNVAGAASFPSIDALPGAPDAAFVGVNRHASVEAIGALSARGAGGAVCFASGFREAQAELADGDTLQAALLEAAGDMPILGPNCYGMINGLDCVALWPDQHGMVPVDRGVAIITQSSNIALNLTMQRRGLPIAYLLTAGNQAQVGLADLGIAALRDSRVTALGLHIEGIGDLRQFEALARAAREIGKPIVALKIGASDQAVAATISHTASLAGGAAGASALLRRLGIGQVGSITAMLEVLKLLHVTGPLSSNRIGSMSCSGGEASLFADTALHHEVCLPPLTPAQSKELRAALGPKVALANPLDYHTYIWGDRTRMARCFAAMADPSLALACVILDFPRADRCNATDWGLVIDSMSDAVAARGVPMAVVSSLPESLPEPVADDLIARGIAPLCGLDDALQAMAIAAQVGGATVSEPLLVPGAGGAARVLSEADAKTALAEFGLAIPESGRALSAGEAAEIAMCIGRIVALKGEDIAHKSEAGAVRLNLQDPAEVRAAAEAMPAETFLVEEMIADGLVELLVGVLRDPAHGYVMTLGAGGTYAELFADTAHILLPASATEIEVALSSLALAPRLTGYRGEPAPDRQAIVSAVLAVQDYVLANAADVFEVEVNPLICTPSRAVAADALIRLRAPSGSDAGKDRKRTTE